MEQKIKRKDTKGARKTVQNQKNYETLNSSIYNEERGYDTPDRENLDYVTEMAKAKLMQLGKSLPIKKKFNIAYLDDYSNPPKQYDYSKYDPQEDLSTPREERLSISKTEKTPL